MGFSTNFSYELAIFGVFAFDAAAALFEAFTAALLIQRVLRRNELLDGRSENAVSLLRLSLQILLHLHDVIAVDKAERAHLDFKHPIQLLTYRTLHAQTRSLLQGEADLILGASAAFWPGLFIASELTLTRSGIFTDEDSRLGCKVCARSNTTE
ncbi:hypothetical protein ACOTEO_25170 [Achromobacter xylosoxidans]|nr:hypothetical protein HMPREF3137_02195 [Achromobacter xylosoxidans]